MSITAILVGAAAFILTAAYVTRPLFNPASSPKPVPGEGPRKQLLAQRDTIYATIRELDFDYQTGKVNQLDYQARRQRYVLEGVQVLKSLDALPQDSERASLAAEIETAIQAARQRRAQGDAMPESRFCPQCGQPTGPDAYFCAQCGAELKDGTRS
jgi:hypothetical protein